MTRTTQRSEWSAEDRLLLVAYRAHLGTICDGCGQPKAQAYHSDNDGWYGVADETVVCHACTAIAQHSNPNAEPVELLRLVHDRNYEKNPLPVFGSAGARKASRGGGHR